MIILCAWCQINMGEKEPIENKNITHGMCKKCGDNFLPVAANTREIIPIKKVNQINEA